MGYSKSKGAVAKVKPLLDAMLVNDTDFKVPSPSPSDLAYAVREAYHIIKLYPKQFAEYQKVLNKFITKTRGDHILLVRKHELIAGAPVLVTPAGLAAGQTLKLDDLATPMQIVGALIKHKPEEAVFTLFNGSVVELEAIHRWTNKNGYHINSVDPLTISKTAGLNPWHP